MLQNKFKLNGLKKSDMNPGMKYIVLTSLLLGAHAVCADDRPQANPATDLSLEQLKATRERPLFIPERRLPAAPIAVVAAAPPPPPPATPPHVLLLGVLTDASGPRAIIQSDGEGKNKAVRLGDDIQGWRVTHIEMRQLVISHDDRDAAISLFGTEHGALPLAVAHRPDRVLEVNSAGVLRSHRIHRD